MQTHHVNFFSRVKKRGKSDRPSQFLGRIIRGIIVGSAALYLNLKFLILKFVVYPNRKMIQRCLGYRLYLDLNDYGLSRDLSLFPTREPYSTQFFQSRLQKGMVVADIGANIGYYALLEAKLVGPNGRVYAIEPVPANIQSLKKNIGLNRCPNIEVIESAIGAKDQTKNIYIAPQANLSSIKKNPRIEYSKQVSVRIRSLDNLLRNRKAPNVVRMDVEGYEIEIIHGMTKTLQDQELKLIFIEIHLPIIGKKASQLIKTLARHGFRITAAINEPPLPIRLLRQNSWLKKIYRQLCQRIDRDHFHNFYGQLSLDLPVERWPSRRSLRLFLERK